MDHNKSPISIFLDLSKAFDTLDHNILIDKLRYYGIRNKSLDLLNSYLTNRRQVVQYDETISKELFIETGVPQGSILGPLLFIIYLNDLVHTCDKFKPIIYADDTALYTCLEAFNLNDQQNYSVINEELEKINNWFKINKLSLNSSKTKAMIFHTAQKKSPNSNSYSR